MRAAWLAVAAAVAAGCGDDLPRFELDVAVTNSGEDGLFVSVNALDVAADCPQAVHAPPAIGTCTSFSDVRPVPCGSWRCITRFGVEVNGATVAQSDAPEDLGGVGWQLPALAASDAAVLVIEGCGTSARLPLPVTALERPQVTSLTYEAGEYVFSWQGAPGATSAIGFVTNGFVGASCHSAGTGPVHVASHDAFVSQSSLSAVADEGTTHTAFGPAHLWRLATAPPLPPPLP